MDRSCRAETVQRDSDHDTGRQGDDRLNAIGDTRRHRRKSECISHDCGTLTQPGEDETLLGASSVHHGGVVHASRSANNSARPAHHQARRIADPNSLNSYATARCTQRELDRVGDGRDGRSHPIGRMQGVGRNPHAPLVRSAPESSSAHDVHLLVIPNDAVARYLQGEPWRSLRSCA